MGVVNYLTVNGEILSETRNGVERDYMPDPLGSTAALLDSTGITDTFTYWPYGEVRSHTGSSTTPFQYVGTLGYYTDSAARYYVRARYLQPEYARWQTVDPLWPRMKAYGYGWQNPTGVTDPSGKDINLCARPTVVPGYCGPQNRLAHWFIEVTGQPGCGSLGLNGHGDVRLDDPDMNRSKPPVHCVTLGTSTDQEKCLCETAKGSKEGKGKCKSYNRGVCKYNPLTHNCQDFIQCIFDACGMDLPEGWHPVL
jgi:RHS repeat-associated protein